MINNEAMLYRGTSHPRLALNVVLPEKFQQFQSSERIVAKPIIALSTPILMADTQVR
jgi:hypothetical protein